MLLRKSSESAERFNVLRLLNTGKRDEVVTALSLVSRALLQIGPPQHVRPALIGEGGRGRALASQRPDLRSGWTRVSRQQGGDQTIPPFWFTTSELLTKPTPVGKITLPLYLVQPEVISKRIWASPVDDTFLNLAD